MDININIGGTVTLTADKLLLSALSGAKIPQEVIPLPQTAAGQAMRAQTIPTPPVAPAPVQAYQPAAPVNPTTAPQQAVPVVPVAAEPVVQTPPSVITSAPPVAPAATFTAPTAMPVNPAPVAAAPAFAMEDLARAASQLMDAGKQQDLLGLLAQFGVQALTQLPKERYGEFATALRQMGAKL